LQTFIVFMPVSASDYPSLSFIDEAILPTIPGPIDCGAGATARAAEEDRRRNHQKQ